MSLMATSSGRRQHQSRQPLGPLSYGSGPGILPDRFSDDEFERLWDAVDNDPDPDFHQIKRDSFRKRHDVTPEMLREACWTKEEDHLLRDTGIRLTSDRGHLEHIAGILEGLKNRAEDIGGISESFRLRSIRVYRIRFAYLEAQRWRDQRPASQPARHVQPDYATPSVAGPSSSRYPDPRPDPQLYLDEEPQGHVDPRGIRLGDNYHDPRPVPRILLGDKYQDGNNHQASRLPLPGGQFGGPHGRQEQGGDRADHEEGVAYVDDTPLTDEILEDFQKKYDPRRHWYKMATPDGRIYSHELFHKVKNAWREKEDKERKEKGEVRKYQPRSTGLTNEILLDIRVKLAQGWTQADILRQEEYSVYNPNTVSNALGRTGWKPWKDQEDMALRAMKDDPGYGDNWAKIRDTDTFRGKRIERELEARWVYISQFGSRTNARGYRTRQYFEFSPADDLYIMLAVAQRYPTVPQMTEQKFLRVEVDVLRNHAREIGANWGKKDDGFLTAEVQRVPVGEQVDWDSIGALYYPPRKGVVLKRRWEYLTTKEVRNIEEIMMEGPH